MKLKTASKPAGRRRSVPRPSRASAPVPSNKGDIARAMFAQWDKTRRDPRPLSWEKLKRTLEDNRLREAPLFAE